MLRNTTCAEPNRIMVDVEESPRNAMSLRFLVRLSAYVSEAQCSHIELVGAVSDLQRALAEASVKCGVWQT
jgi:hypothetical protein